ncbi:MAG: serine hydrolase [Candidatus Hodarchaeota archaeon]
MEKNADIPQDFLQNKTSTPRTQYNNNFANLTGHAWEVRRVKFSPNGQILASSSHDGSIMLWDVTSGEVLRVLQRHYYSVVSLAFSPDGTILASGGWDKKINLWNLTTGELLQAYSISPHVPMDLAFSPDGLSIAVGSGVWGKDWTGSQQNTLKLLNVTNGEILQNFTGHDDAVSSVVFSIDGTWLASGSWDNTIKLWNITTGTEIRSFENHTHIISSIDISSDGLKLASGSFDKTIKIWEVDSGIMLKNLSILAQEVWSVSFSNNNSLLAAAVGQLDYWPRPDRFWEYYGDMQDSSIQLWDIENGILKDTLEGHDHIIESIEFSPDGTILASGSWDWTVKLWGDYPPLPGEIQTDEWSLSSPIAEGMDSTALNQISEQWASSLHSLLIIRNGKLIFEKYYGDSNHVFNKDSKHVLFSVTKSFTSALIGIAIDKGFIASIDQYVLEFFPEYNFSNVDSRKESMTLRHLLTMTSGLAWSEQPTNDDLRRMCFSLDSVQYVLDKLMSSEPGSYYRYNSGASHLLSAIIQQTTGKTTLEFAWEYLFEPLGFDEHDIIWMADSHGNAFGGIGLFLTPRNMAKLGQLYLSKGIWKGSRIISNQWIEISSRDHVEGIPGFIPLGALSGYGFQWWISEELNGYSAEGYEGKMIFVHPAKELVIVFTADVDPSVLQYIVGQILEAVIPANNISWSFFPILLSIIIPIIFITLLIRRKIRREMF